MSERTDVRALIKARNATVAVAEGRIVADEGSFDVVIDARDADVRPGLINAHDHLHRNHYGRLGYPPYPNAFAWAEDIQRRYRRRIAVGRRRPRREALLAGAWKNLFAGVTTVVHHDPWEADFDHDFPIRVARVGSADSTRSSEALARIDVRGPYCIHVAEDAGSSSDLEVLNSAGLLTDNLLAVHAVGLAPPAIEQFRSSGAGVVWCPSSNVFMLGRTASSELLEDGVDVLLGSDSLLTGSANLLEELRFAKACAVISDEDLEKAVGSTAAARLGLPAPTLDPGSPADLILVRAPLLEARASDVDLVLVGGVPRVASNQFVGSFRNFAGKIRKTVGGVTRWIDFSSFKTGNY